MSEPPPHATPGTRITPRRVFGVLAVLVIVAALFAPLPEDRGAPALSSWSHQPTGARGLYESLDRLGFDVSRRTRAMRADSLATDVAWLVLSPNVELTATETHNLLNAVRSGAGLLLVPSLDSGTADSLGLRRAAAAPAGRRAEAGPADTTLIGGDALLRWVLRPAGEPGDSDRVLQPEAGAVRLLDAETREGREPVVLGLHLGAGRIVVSADPDLFANSTLREITPAVRTVRLIEWLEVGSRRPLVFDEYHHGYGTHADVLGVAARAVAATGAGRMLIQLAIAGLALLIAVSQRPILPVARERFQRRSPLEHVGALARAYSAVGARGRAARLLVRGLRRRYGGRRSDRDEAAWLAAIAAMRPAAGDAAQRLTDAIEAGAGPGQEEAIAAAVLHIEEVISP